MFQLLDINQIQNIEITNAFTSIFTMYCIHNVPTGTPHHQHTTYTLH